MTGEVEVTPLITVVKVLPERDWVKELIILETLEETPFTIVWKRLLEEEETLVLIIFVLEDFPFTLEVKTFPEEERVLVVLEAFKVEIVFCADGDKERLPVIFKSLVLVVEAVMFLVKRSVKYPVTPLIMFEKKLVVVALVILALVELRVVIVALVILAVPKIGLSVKM